MSLKPETRGAIVSRIYSAALDPSEWSGMLEALAAELDGAKLHLFGHDLAQDVDLGIQMAGHDPDWIDAYRRELVRLNPYPPRATGDVVGRPIDLRHLMPEEELRRTRFYGEFMAPQENLTGGTGFILELDPTRVLVLGTLHPDRHRDRIGDRPLATLTELARALKMGWSLSKMAGGPLFEAAVRRSVAPMAGVLLVIDALGRALYLDKAAEVAAEAGRWFRIDARGRITFGDGALHARILRLTQEMARGGERIDGFVSRSTLSGDEAIVHALPLDPEALVRWHGAFVLGLLRPCVLVAIIPVARIGSPTDRLRELGLTAAETEVVLSLVEGLTPEEIAERRRASVHTVRNQIKAAMWKCGVTRQAQLVALAARL